MLAPVGFIGLGVMGRPMALNLLAGGIDLVVHSRSAGPVDELVAEGATRASSPREVACACETTILMLPDDTAVEAVLEGPDGLLTGTGPGHLVIDMGTVSPETDRRLASRVAEQGAAMLDAPVSGGDVGAKTGTLSIMVGGSADLFERARPLFEILGATIVHVGELGSGQVVKACNQVVVALTIEAVAEALVLGSGSGVAPETIVRVLSGGLAASRVLELRGPNMLAHRFDPGFAIALHHKDLGIALSTARANGVSLPATALVDQMLASLRQHGQGGLDHSALLTHIEALADHTIGVTGMNDTRQVDAARALWNAWTDGRTIPELPADQRPTEIVDGYRIQSKLDEFAGRRVGWKLAATGAGGRAALGVEQPLAGPLYERFALAPGASLDFSTVRMRTVEAEFGFIMAGSLPAVDAPFDRISVLERLGSFVPAIEIPNTRYDNHRTVGGPQLIADAACAGFFVLGDRVEDYDPETLPSGQVTLTTSNGSADGTGAKVLGDPIEAVRWLANELARQGRELSAGDVVITGAAAAVKEPGVGRVVADFGPLGSIALNLT